LQHLKKRAGVDARLLDLRDFPMPFFDQPVSPASPGRPHYKNEVVQKWTAAIAQSDGFVFVTPGITTALRCSRTPSTGFIRVGSQGGKFRELWFRHGRAASSSSAKRRSSFSSPGSSIGPHPVATLWAHYKGGDVDAGLSELEANAGR
jgi:hypothetical protein